MNGGRPVRREVHHRAQGVDVGPGVERAVADGLLGRHVQRRAADRHVAGQLGGARVLGQLDQAEVEHLGDVRLAAPDRDEDVGGLQVAVDQAQPRAPRPAPRRPGGTGR